MTAPGWYPDPSGAPTQRYFDGTTWTDQYAPLQQAPKKSRTWLWVLLTIFGVMVLGFGGCVAFVGSVASNMDSTTSSTDRAGSSSGTDGSAPDAPTIAPAGEAVRDGKFEFKIVDVSSSKTVSDPSGNPYMTTDAQGVYVVITLQITNIGNEPQNFFGSNQKLFDNAGREYGVDSRADMYMNAGDSVMGDINPGNSITRKLAFDVPPDSMLTYLQLHDSMLSGGVKLAIPE